MDDHKKLQIEFIIEDIFNSIRNSTEPHCGLVIKLAVNILEVSDWLDADIVYILKAVRSKCESGYFGPLHSPLATAECTQYIKEKKE